MTRTPITVLGVLALALAACGSDSASESPEPTDTPAPDVSSRSQAADTDFEFLLVTPSPLGDGSFIDASARGAERAETDLGVAGTIVESQGPAEQEASLRSALSQAPDLVLALGLESTTVIDLANEFPDQLIGVPSDFFADELPDNVAAFQVNTHEASFLAGLAAGSLTQTGTVGGVMGGDAPGLNQFFYAYQQGVLEACPDCEVLSSYLDFNFSDPTLGQEAALAQYGQGADIIFAIAGLSGQGVIQAAEDSGNYAIGVDANQDGDAPGTVIVSVMKRVDETTFQLIEETLNGEFKPGFSQLGLAEGASALSWDEGSTVFADNGPDDVTALLPDAEALVEDYRTQILDGSYEVCDALNDPESDACAPFTP